MPIEKAFLADIIEHPEDDAPRLVYADWLDDHDQPDLARFIRVQIERARLAEYDPRQSDLALIGHRLLTRCQPAMLLRLGLPETLDGVALRWVFRRGFPEGCFPVPAASLLAHAGHLFSSAPLRELGLTDIRPVARQLANLPFLSRLHGLGLLGRSRAGQVAINASTLATLLGSAHLEEIEDFNLADNDLDNPAVEILIGWRGLSRLRRLWLGRNLIDGTGVTSLVYAANIRGLRLLSLERLHLREQDLISLGRSPHLDNLEELDLSACLSHLTWRGDPVLVRLASSGRLQNLRCLRFGHNDLGLAGVEALAAWPRLQVLDLRGSHLGPPGGKALASLPQASQLTELHLKDSSLNDEGLTALLAANPPLRVLDLRDNGLTPAGLAGLSGWAALGQVHTLRLGANWIRARGVSHLVASPHLGQLRRLDLSRSSLGNAGIAELLQAPFLAQLQELTLDGNGLDDQSVRLLLDSPAVAEIPTLSVREEQPFSAEIRERLARRLSPDTGAS